MLTIFCFQIADVKDLCNTIGTLWPQLFFGSSVPPKVDALVFVVPEFAAKWSTLGGVGEERGEALHGTYNHHDRVLAPMKNKGKAMGLAMKRENMAAKARKVVGPIHLAAARKYSNPEARAARYGKGKGGRGRRREGGGV